MDALSIFPNVSFLEMFSAIKRVREWLRADEDPVEEDGDTYPNSIYDSLEEQLRNEVDEDCSSSGVESYHSIADDMTQVSRQDIEESQIQKVQMALSELKRLQLSLVDIKKKVVAKYDEFYKSNGAKTFVLGRELDVLLMEKGSKKAKYDVHVKKCMRSTYQGGLGILLLPRSSKVRVHRQ
jgi:hypothetical protein